MVLKSLWCVNAGWHSCLTPGCWSSCMLSMLSQVSLFPVTKAPSPTLLISMCSNLCMPLEFLIFTLLTDLFVFLPYLLGQEFAVMLRLAWN